MTKNPNRFSKGELGVEKNPIPFEPVHKTKFYFQVIVGQYGVVLPDTINMDTLDGLTLIEGKASVITNKVLAEKVTEKTGGIMYMVEETFKRETKDWRLVSDRVKGEF